MEETAQGNGRFTDVLLRPRVTIGAGGDTALAARLHHEAHDFCFIANSVNFPVRCEPVTDISTI
jgi:organic hydroperoxide reductase OsmC/OhrA